MFFIDMRRRIYRSKRFIWIDWAKVIGMYAIIFGHFFPARGSGFVYSFSVPLFFFLSGFLTKENSCTIQMAWRKVKDSLFFPALIFVVLNWLFFIKNDLCFTYETTIEPFFRLLRGRYAPLMGGMWFVFDLIIIRMLMLTLPKYFIRILGSFSFLMMLVLYKNKICEATLWVNIWGGFFYAWLGNEANKFNYINLYLNYQHKTLSETLFRIIISVLLASIIFFMIDDSLYIMLTNSLGSSFVLTLLSSFLGITMILLSSSVFQTLPYWLHLINIGAIPILGLHCLIINVIVAYYNGGGSYNFLFSSWGYALWSLVIMLLFIPIIWILNTYFPIVCGKRK